MPQPTTIQVRKDVSTIRDQYEIIESVQLTLSRDSWIGHRAHKFETIIKRLWYEQNELKEYYAELLAIEAEQNNNNVHIIPNDTDMLRQWGADEWGKKISWNSAEQNNNIGDITSHNKKAPPMKRKKYNKNPKEKSLQASKVVKQTKKKKTN